MYKIYSFLLASIIGCELMIGVIVAPIIFKGNFLFETLPDFNTLHSGILMGQIFDKFNYALFMVAVISFLIELFLLFDKKMSFNLRISRFCLSFIALFCSCLFVFYFTDLILEAKSLQDIQSVEFKNIHDASEYVFKIILISQMVLFFLPNNAKVNK